MLIGVDQIVVGDRIRRDLGDLEELADDIRANTLLNPLVVTPNGDDTYALVAGERRLRAMRDVLGHKQVNVSVVSVRDAGQALSMEISENECRKEFTKTERLEYARRLARIEAAKAKERMVAGKAQDPTANLPEGETREIVAAQLGTSATQLRREQFIADNADMLDPTDFAGWDEGGLSTNKAFQHIKAAMMQAELERDEARDEQLEAYNAAELTDDKLASIGCQFAQHSELEVTSRVVPEGCEDDVLQPEGPRSERQQVPSEEQRVCCSLGKANGLSSEDGWTNNARCEIEKLIAATRDYLRRWADEDWALDQLHHVDGVTRRELIKSVDDLVAFSRAIYQKVESMRG